MPKSGTMILQEKVLVNACHVSLLLKVIQDDASQRGDVRVSARRGASCVCMQPQTWLQLVGGAETTLLNGLKTPPP
jgi:hypothetical protein